MARLSNLAQSTLSGDLDTAPPKLVVPIRRQKRLKTEEVDELLAMYESGMSVNQLASQVKIHRNTVMAHLKRRGVETRPAVRRLTDQQVQQAAELYATGLSLVGVALEFGVDAEVIRRELIRLGVSRRTPGHQATC